MEKKAEWDNRCGREVYKRRERVLSCSAGEPQGGMDCITGLCLL